MNAIIALNRHDTVSSSTSNTSTRLPNTNQPTPQYPSPTYAGSLRGALARMSLSPAGSVTSTPGDSSGYSSSVNLAAHDDLSIPEGTLSPRFDKYWQNSDLALRSSDDVLFRVHKARLAGSSVFEDMFEMGAIGGNRSDKNNRTKANICTFKEPIPVITLAEDAKTLELVLPFFYDEYPEVDSMAFKDVLSALVCSLKYGMPLVEHIYTARMRRMLPSLTVDQAFQLWTKCSTLDKPELANEALRLTAKGDIMQFPVEGIELLDTRSVDKLWRTHMSKSQKQTDILFNYAWHSARGNCYYFQQAAHQKYMQALLEAKCGDMPCEAQEPLGFRTCEKCSKMAEELALPTGFK